MGERRLLMYSNLTHNSILTVLRVTGNWQAVFSMRLFHVERGILFVFLTDNLSKKGNQEISVRWYTISKRAGATQSVPSGGQSFRLHSFHNCHFTFFIQHSRRSSTITLF